MHPGWPGRLVSEARCTQNRYALCDVSATRTIVANSQACNRPFAGRHAAGLFCGPSSVTTQLYVRAMDGLEAQPIPGTEGGTTPFFSPDGQWVGFSAGGKLKKILLSGGAPVTLAGDVAPAGVIGASWSSQGMIAF